MKTRYAVALLAVLGLAACIPSDKGGPMGPPEATFPDLLPQQELYILRSFSGIQTRIGRIITDAAGLQAAWDEVFAHYSADQKPWVPAIDFRQNVVLLASAGPTPTQLDWFRITKVRERPEHLAVLVESQWPACGGLAVTTNPVHIVTVPRVATQAVFEFVDHTEPCS
jgi:hypothetical protein